MKSSKILVTGASGFVGRSLSAGLSRNHQDLVLCTRRRPEPASNWVCGPSLDSKADWTALLEGVDTVVHLAGKAHGPRSSTREQSSEFDEINVAGTLRLARQAVQAGIRHFIFISSIGVNGSRTDSIPFSELSLPCPGAPYAVSKLRAEEELLELAAGSAMSLTIIRPPLVYGADAPGNFASLLKLVASGIPLPLAGIANKRSMIAIDNLVEFIQICINNPKAENELFLISDAASLSIQGIIENLSVGMGLHPRLFRIPLNVLRLAATIAGRKNQYSQVCDSLVVDSSKARRVLNWFPGISPEEALKTAGKDYVLSKK